MEVQWVIFLDGGFLTHRIIANPTLILGSKSRRKPQLRLKLNFGVAWEKAI